MKRVKTTIEIDGITTVDAEQIKDLMSASKDTSRRRAALPIHKSNADIIQRVLIGAQTDTYIAPHKHPDKKWEQITLIQGALDILLFTDDGMLFKRISLKQHSQILCEYPANQLHAAVILEPNTLVLEVKEGPYVPETAKTHPDWAPIEGSYLTRQALEKLYSLAEGQHFHLV